MAKTKISVTDNAVEDMEKVKQYFIAVWIANLYKHSGNQSGSFSEN